MNDILPTNDPDWRLLAREQSKVIQRMGEALRRIAKPIEPPSARVHSRERYWEKAATDRISQAAKALNHVQS